MRKTVIRLILLFLLSAAMLFAQSLVQSRAIIKPSIVHLSPGQAQQFKVVLLATRLMAASNPDKVSWFVNDIPGGNSKVGTIDENGVYTAPKALPSPPEIHIIGKTDEAQNKFVFATVLFNEREPVYRSVRIWSEKKGDPATRLQSPHGIGLDKEGNILIADQTASQIFRYTADGKYLGEIGRGPGSEPGQFNTPREVRSDSEGYIYVTDSKGDRPRVQVFSHEGEFVRIFGIKGRGPGQLLRCHGIGFGPTGNIFITDVDNMRVNVYDPVGNFLYDFGGGRAYKDMNPGEMNAPHGLFVDRSGDVFVNSYYGPTQKFTPEGAYLIDFGHGDPPDGPVYFHSLTGDKWGNVYLLVRSKGGYQGAIEEGGAKKISVVKYNNNGDYVTSWGFTSLKHSETTAVVDENGLVYALFVGESEMGVEIFREE